MLLKTSPTGPFFSFVWCYTHLKTSVFSQLSIWDTNGETVVSDTSLWENSSETKKKKKVMASQQEKA